MWFIFGVLLQTIWITRTQCFCVLIFHARRHRTLSDEFLYQAGVTVGELDAEAAKPQPTSLSLHNYNQLVGRLSQSHPGFKFDSKSRRLRVLKRSALPAQILRSKQNIRAWEREFKPSTHVPNPIKCWSVQKARWGSWTTWAIVDSRRSTKTTPSSASASTNGIKKRILKAMYSASARMRWTCENNSLNFIFQ